MIKVKTKKIVIATKGPLRIKGGIMGPIDIPYTESVSTIAQMLLNRYKVYEVLDSGKKILLDLQNYNTKNDESGKSVVNTISKPVITSTKDKKNIQFTNKIEESAKKQNKIKPIGLDVYTTKGF